MFDNPPNRDLFSGQATNVETKTESYIQTSPDDSFNAHKATCNLVSAAVEQGPKTLAFCLSRPKTEATIIFSPKGTLAGGRWNHSVKAGSRDEIETTLTRKQFSPVTEEASNDGYERRLKRRQTNSMVAETESNARGANQCCSSGNKQCCDRQRNWVTFVQCRLRSQDLRIRILVSFLTNQDPGKDKGSAVLDGWLAVFLQM